MLKAKMLTSSQTSTGLLEINRKCLSRTTKRKKKKIVRERQRKKQLVQRTGI